MHITPASETRVASTGENAHNTAFAQFGLASPLLRALAESTYVQPTPIQAEAIPALMTGRDLLGIAQTGTGKTAAFALPILHSLTSAPRQLSPKGTHALVLAPTRELVIQITENLRQYGKYIRMRSCAVFGGVSEAHQIKAMSGGVDVLIATPGRLLDLAERGFIRLGGVQTFVLDEADRMLDMGFIRDVKKIAAMLPEKRQSLLFSATMPGDIAGLAANLLRDPVRVEVTPQVVTVERIAQKVHFVNANQKRPFLTALLADVSMTRVVVFTRTKHVANRVSEHLNKAGIASDAIHGNKSQNARQKALESFKKGTVRVLVATDIAARGIHVSDVSHVVNYELPNMPESYVHRIGRTARAGASGQAISLCDQAERGFLKDIQKFIKMTIPAADDTSRIATFSVAHDRPDRERGENRVQHNHRQDEHHGRDDGRSGQKHRRRDRGRHRKNKPFEGLRAENAKERASSHDRVERQGGERPDHAGHRSMTRAQHDRDHADRHFGEGRPQEKAQQNRVGDQPNRKFGKSKHPGRKRGRGTGNRRPN